MNRNLDIQIDEQFKDRVSDGWLMQTMQAVLSSESVNYPVDLSLLVTDDTVVQGLNRTYRGIDRTTDVLAFALQEDSGGIAFPAAPDGILHLGEVIISCPQAERQAEEQGHSLRHELATLVIHGALHLLGYDHERGAEEELAMKAREARILTDLRQ